MDIEKKALIEKLAQTDGPRRELDVEIARHIGLFDGTRADYTLQAKMIPAYTASIDAALTLVPDGATGLISIGLGYARIERSDGTHWSGDAATPALALCIAALSAKEPSQ